MNFKISHVAVHFGKTPLLLYVKMLGMVKRTNDAFRKLPGAFHVPGGSNTKVFDNVRPFLVFTDFFTEITEAHYTSAALVFLTLPKPNSQKKIVQCQRRRRHGKACLCLDSHLQQSYSMCELSQELVT